MNLVHVNSLVVTIAVQTNFPTIIIIIGSKIVWTTSPRRRRVFCAYFRSQSMKNMNDGFYTTPHLQSDL